MNQAEFQTTKHVSGTSTYVQIPSKLGEMTSTSDNIANATAERAKTVILLNKDILFQGEGHGRLQKGDLKAIQTPEEKNKNYF